MRHINGLYTQRYNRLNRTDGALFRGRYKTVLVDTSDYLLEVSRYIHRNPIETKKTMVEVLEQYPWSSYPYYIKKRKVPEWLYQDSIFGDIGSKSPYRRYREFVAAGNDHEIETFYGSKKLSAILGNKVFKENALVGVDLSGDVVEKESRQVLSFDDVLDAVAGYYDCDREAVLSVSRGRQPRNYARWMAMKFCQTLAQMRLTEMAEKFGVGNYCTVSQTIHRLDVAMKEYKGLVKIFNSISKDLTP